MTNQNSEHKADILIVDDTPENLSVLRQMLADNGYRVRPALSGEMALKTIEKDLPDIILMDIRMPGKDGYEICSQLKSEKTTHDIPVIFISALNDIEDKVKAFSLGGVDYITKPFKAEEILARVKTHLTLRILQLQMEKKNSELQKALDEIKTLRGIIPICASCKKIRNDDGYWEQLEIYIQEHSEAEFSHSCCLECAKKLYPEFVDENGNFRKSHRAIS